MNEDWIKSKEGFGVYGDIKSVIKRIDWRGIFLTFENEF